MKISIHRYSYVERSMRIRQLESLFDVPVKEKISFDLETELPIEERPWNVGLIVGPSGCGKTQVLQYGICREPAKMQMIWNTGLSVIDNVACTSIDDITQAFQAVGFNTIPSWMKPIDALSTGEQFRVYLARSLAEAKERAKGGAKDYILMDEFTSVVDRQVAQIGSYAVSKYVRKHGLQFVAASCHYDIIDWLQPDWIYEPAINRFQWRELHRRPPIEIDIGRCSYKLWPLFAPFHYMSQDLNKAARCYALYANGNLASFCGVLHRPHARVRDILGVSRVVTLPDWQGLGLAMCLVDTLAGAYTAIGKRFRNYPNHPAFVRSHQRSPKWKTVKESGSYSPRRGDSSTVGGFGGRPCAVFEYIGEALSLADAKVVLGE